MKKINPVILIFSMAAIFLLCTGWNNSWQELKETAGNVHSVKADFIQEKHLKILKKNIVSRGHLFYRSPDSLRWEYVAPFRSILMMHGGKTTQYLKKEHGFEKSSGSGTEFMQIGLREISRWLSGHFEETSFFSVRLVPGEKIIFTAKDPSVSKFVNKIELIFSDKPGIMKSVRIYESEDSYTNFLFENTVINEEIDTSWFTEIKR